MQLAIHTVDRAVTCRYQHQNVWKDTICYGNKLYYCYNFIAPEGFIVKLLTCLFSIPCKCLSFFLLFFFFLLFLFYFVQKWSLDILETCFVWFCFHKGKIFAFIMNVQCIRNNESIIGYCFICQFQMIDCISVCILLNVWGTNVLKE